MNSAECTQLDDFLDQLERSHEIEKFAEARAMFERAVAQQLDSSYVLVRRGLPPGRELNQAKARIGASGEAADSHVVDVDSAAGDPLFI